MGFAVAISVVLHTPTPPLYPIVSLPFCFFNTNLLVKANL
jgi:hypothetical protein